jgi:hypothetical protein
VTEDRSGGEGERRDGRRLVERHRQSSVPDGHLDVDRPGVPSSDGHAVAVGDEREFPSHELRLEILFALWAAPEHSLAFSDIRTAVGEQDSGRFTYHLEQLTDHFVTEVDGEYVLQYAGPTAKSVRPPRNPVFAIFA